MYVYRITAKKIETPVGTANVMQFAYKPWRGWGEDVDKRNNALHRKTGCYAAEGMVKRGNHTGLAAAVREDGTIEAVYETGDRATFDDWWMEQRGTAWMAEEVA